MKSEAYRFFQAIKAVIWSFFGVRKAKDHEQDHAQLNPVHIILAGLLLAAVLVCLLISIAYRVSEA